MTVNVKTLTAQDVSQNGASNEKFATLTVGQGEIYYVDMVYARLSAAMGTNDWDVGGGILDPFGHTRIQKMGAWYDETAGKTYKGSVGAYAYPGETIFIGDGQDTNGSGVADVFMGIRRVL